MNYGYGNTYGGFFDKMSESARAFAMKIPTSPGLQDVKAIHRKRTADPCSHIPSTIDNCPPGAQCFMGPQANPEWVACREAVRLAEEEAQREAIRQEVRTEMQPVPWWAWAVGGAALAMLVVRR